MNSAFQWASVAAAVISFFGVVATIVGTIYTNKRTIKANIALKIRGGWLQKIIELSSELMDTYDSLDRATGKIYLSELEKELTTYVQHDEIIHDPIKMVEAQKNLDDRKRLDEIRVQYGNEFNEASNKIGYISNQLLLYFLEEPESEVTYKLIYNLKENARQFGVFLSDINSEKLKDNSYNEELQQLYLTIKDETVNNIEEYRSSVSKYLILKQKALEDLK